MEKILLALDPVNSNSKSLEFACYLGALTNSKITGLFAGKQTGDMNDGVQELMQDGFYSNYKQSNDFAKAIEKKEKIKSNLSVFTEACEKHAIRHSVHFDHGDPAREIIGESRYADVLVIDAGLSFGKKNTETPSPVVKKILREAECPVITVPEHFTGIEEIIFTFDGSKSSVFSIKQFCHLFPQLDDKKVTLLQVDEENLCSVEQRQQLKEWLSSHYSSIGFTTLKGDAGYELIEYLHQKEKAFIIMGAYGRSPLSEAFKPSRGELLVKMLNQAIFIAHY